MIKPSSNGDWIVAGIDIGGTNTEIGLIDSSGNCLNKTVLRTSDYADPQILTLAMSSAIEEMAGKEIEGLKGIGIGAPNGNFYSGSIEHAPNLIWKGVLPLADMMHQHIPVPVALTNDANAAAVGEMKYGKAKGMKHFISVTIGTGLGTGIVVNGDILYGHTGFAGELGHTTSIPNGRQCTCGKKGCLETYVSARGLVMTTQELLAKDHKTSHLVKLDQDLLTPYRIHQAAKEGDPVATEAFEVLGQILGRALADTVALFSPEAIFLFGGLTRAGDLLLNPARKALNECLLPIFKDSVKLELSSLNEDNAAILGAGALILNQISMQ